MNTDLTGNDLPNSAGNSRIQLPQVAYVATATVVLVAIGGFLAPQSVSLPALLTLLPFMSILGVAAIGQHLVVQQRGFDISVAGIISLSAVIVTNYAERGAGAGPIVVAVLLALAAGAGTGAINGFFVTLLRVPPLVTTIGINALAIGVTVYLSGGVPRAVPDALGTLALGRTLGIPNTFVVMLIIAAIVIFVERRTVIGRQFIAIGTNPSAARVLGVRVTAYSWLTYTAAGLFFALAGVMLSGFVSVPTIMCGNEYMLSTVAAVVVGGNALTGGRASIPATILGAFFLTYLGQLVLSVGFERAVQDVVKATIIILGVALPEIVRRLRNR
ncbi:ABC transporter permease [Oricola nitratireducens]|uniref:ABC transporter permease n=1 Tax=Oricola nitratireducens TaxID=2775868 RepID=UPI0018695AA7|nr:ABC transporter permease [Oricola nitratireducens]